MTREDRMLRASLACLTVIVLIVLGARLGELYGFVNVVLSAMVLCLACGVTFCLAMMADGR